MTGLITQEPIHECNPFSPRTAGLLEHPLVIPNPALHEAEEWNIVQWYQRNYIGLPPMTNKSARVGLACVSLMGFLWSTVAILTQNPKVAAYVLVPAMVFIVLNALQHIYWLCYFRQYAPGVITAVVLLLPTIGYLTVRAIQEKHILLGYVVALTILIVPSLNQTVKAGNTLTPLIRAVHNLGIGLSKRF